MSLLNDCHMLVESTLFVALKQGSRKKKSLSCSPGHVVFSCWASNIQGSRQVIL